MSCRDNLMLMSEIGDDLISELTDDFRKERQNPNNKIWIGVLIGVCAALALTTGILVRTIGNKSYTKNQETSPDITTISLAFNVVINGKNYGDAGPATAKKYNLPSNQDITTDDLGELIGEVEECIQVPEMIGTKAYRYAGADTSGMIIILEIDGAYEFYECVD